MNIESPIYEIGQRLVMCKQNCPGIAVDQRNGILPRCLILQSEGRDRGQGSIIVGINPGPSNEIEQKYYRKEPSYSQVITYWKDRNLSKDRRPHKYYSGLTRLVDSLGFTGQILWTELVKCENESRETRLSFRNYPKTFRICTSLYLQKEIEVTPPDWPVIAVGGDAYSALSFLYTDRMVIGVPHPTGSHGHFGKLFSRGKLKSTIKSQVSNIEKTGNVVWLRIS